MEPQLASHADIAIDTAVSSAATKTMGAGGAGAAVGWLTSNEGIALIGLLLAIVGFVINLIFQLRRDRREAELQLMELKALAVSLEKTRETTLPPRK